MVDIVDALRPEFSPEAAAELLRRKAARDQLLAFAAYQMPDYVAAPHHRIIADRLEKVERGEITRLMISMPPRHGKSQLASRLFPAWFMGRNPKKQVIAASYNSELARDFGRDVRNIVGGAPFLRLFKDVQLSQDSTAADRWHTSEGGAYIAAGVGTATTGRGAHLLLIDDPVKDREAADSAVIREATWNWYTSVAYTRLMPGGSVVLIQTRWHEDDLAGRLLRQMKNGDGDRWEVLSLPAIDEAGEALWPDWYPIERLEQIRSVVGPRDWSALYQQSPRVEGGAILKRDWWRRWERPEPPECQYILQSWDTAFSERQSADYSALTTWGVFGGADDATPNAILLGARKGRWSFPDLKRVAIEEYRKHKPDLVLIEQKASGMPLHQELRAAGVPVIPYSPTRDKVTRAHTAAVVLEGGRVWAPEKAWSDEVIDECAAFPAGAHDDYVDSVTQALIRIRSGGSLPVADDEEDRPRRARRVSYYGLPTAVRA